MIFSINDQLLFEIIKMKVLSESTAMHIQQKNPKNQAKCF